MSDAASISVADTLHLLSGPFASFTEGLYGERYAIWLGSGLSRDRMPDLHVLVIRVLEHLRVRIDPSDPACRFGHALQACLELATLGPSELPAIDLAQPVQDWTIRQVLSTRLGLRYADLLNIQVDGEAPDYMLWDAVRVIETYAPLDPDPDCEHLCLAILILEGSLPNIVSANWDGLVEAAVDELAGTAEHPLRVCVLPEDLLEPPGRSVMYKLHGCAVLARDNPAVYRDVLIARARQITAWTAGLWTDAAKNRLIDLAATKRTFMVGLSAQDSNIQFIFVQGASRITWPWPSDPPSHVFAEDSIGVPQRSILQHAYGAAYDSNRTEIESAALLRAFAKPLLVALVLDLLAAKLAMCVEMQESPALTDANVADLVSGVMWLRDLVAAHADGDRVAFVRSLIAHLYRATSLFRDGRPNSHLGGSYRPVSTVPPTRMVHDPDVASSGLVEMSVALGVIGLAEHRNHWKVRAGDPAVADDGVLVLSAKSTARVFFASNPGAAAAMLSGVIDDTTSGDVVVIHSQPTIDRLRRSPRSALGRSGSARPREIGMASLLSECTDLDHLIQRMREEVGV